VWLARRRYGPGYFPQAHLPERRAGTPQPAATTKAEGTRWHQIESAVGGVRTASYACKDCQAAAKTAGRVRPFGLIRRRAIRGRTVAAPWSSPAAERSGYYGFMAMGWATLFVAQGGGLARDGGPGRCNSGRLPAGSPVGAAASLMVERRDLGRASGLDRASSHSPSAGLA